MISADAANEIKSRLTVMRYFIFLPLKFWIENYLLTFASYVSGYLSGYACTNLDAHKHTQQGFDR